MRTLLTIVLFLATAAPLAVAQPATPPAPPGGVEAPVAVTAAPPPVPAVSEAPAAPVVPTPLAQPPAEISARPEAPVAPVTLPANAPAPEAAPLPAPTAPSALPAQSPEAPTTYPPVAPEKPVEPYVRRSAGAPVALAAGGGLAWNDDPGYRLAGDKRRPQFDAMASYDILQPTKHLVISLGASIRHAKAEADDALTIVDNTLQAELMARLAFPSWIWPHVRASVGGAWTRVKLSDGVGTHGTIEDRDVGLVSSFGGGITLRTPARALETASGHLASLSLGVLVEGGYNLGQAASLSGVPSGSTDVARGAVKLGSLDRNAPYLRILGVVRF